MNAGAVSTRNEILLWLETHAENDPETAGVLLHALNTITRYGARFHISIGLALLSVFSLVIVWCVLLAAGGKIQTP